MCIPGTITAAFVINGAVLLCVPGIYNNINSTGPVS